MKNLELTIAWRYLRSKRKDGFISLIAGFAFVGIMLGVATLIIVMSVMNGFRQEFISHIVGFNGHISAYSQSNDGIYGYDEIISKFKNHFPNIEEISPIIERQAMLVSEKQVMGVVLRGMQCQDLTNKKIISNNITYGRAYSNNDDANEIMIGKYLARKLGVWIGDKVKVITPEINEGGFGYIPRAKTFFICGIFTTGMHEYDSSFAFIPLNYAQKLFKLDGCVSQMELTFKDNNISPKTNKKLSKLSKDYQLALLNWQEKNKAFMSAVAVERNVMFLILTLIVMVASLNVISCMVMLVRDKSRDIAILRTIGMQKWAIIRVFMMTGFFIGCIGTVLGTILGLLFCNNIEKIRRVLEILLKTNLFPDEVYYLYQLPAVINTREVILTVCIALLLSFLSTIYPALRAGKISPAETLKYE